MKEAERKFLALKVLSLSSKPGLCGSDGISRIETCTDVLDTGEYVVSADLKGSQSGRFCASQQVGWQWRDTRMRRPQETSSHDSEFVPRRRFLVHGRCSRAVHSRRNCGSGLCLVSLLTDSITR